MIDPITPTGLAALHAEYTQLMQVERPAIVEVVSWAAGNGDRSENGDYIYGRQRLRAIDRRASHLARRMEAVTPVDPAAQIDKAVVRFGATVLVTPEDDDSDDAWRRVTLVGDDETERLASYIGWRSPMARALIGARVGEVREVTLPGGTRAYRVVEIEYPNAD